MWNMEYQEIVELRRTIRTQYEKVKALAAFASLKQSEIRDGDEISITGFIAAKEELHTEAAVLDGHVQLLESQVNRGRIILNHETRVLIDHVQKLWFQRHFEPEDFR